MGTLSEPVTCKALDEAYEAAIRNIDQKTIAQIQAGTLTEEDCKEPVVRHARDVYQSLMGALHGAGYGPIEDDGFSLGAQTC